MKQKQLQAEIISKLPHTPTNEQDDLIQKLSQFVIDMDPRSVFLLKGYAGTGKTTVISALVNSLSKFNRKSLLLAPTGRAAKVVSGYSRRGAYTIHKKIYTPAKKADGQMYFKLKENKATNTIFIIDESSMIQADSTDGKFFSGSGLLADLMEFVYSGVNCKIIFVGDTAQLPPVHLVISPALDKEFLEQQFGKKVTEVELKNVVRQESESGILYNATTIRNRRLNAPQDFKFDTNGFTDVVRLTEGFEIEEALNDSYQECGVEGTIVIVRSNKRANLYNQQIRARIRWQEDELSVGDYLMVVKNDYFWLDKKSKIGFIANGDIIEVQEIRAIKELYGFRFAEVTIRMVDYPDEQPIDTILLLDTLTVDGPSLSYADNNRMYKAVLEDYADIAHKYVKYQKVKNNEYFNALQVKFAYSVTCHKAQGGQWQNVFIEQAYLPDGTIDEEYLRWLYTAFTRAQKKVHLIGFKDSFFVE